MTPDTDDAQARIDGLVKASPVVLFMKGSPLFPQCGFSSTVHGNNIAVLAQRDKLRLVVETAQEVWGE